MRAFAWRGQNFQVVVKCFPGGSMRFRIAILIGVLLSFAGIARAAEETALLAHSPTVSKTHVAFTYGGYLLRVPRAGGDERQLTTGGHERRPMCSHDVKWFSFLIHNDS